MSSSNAPVINDDGTTPSSQAVDLAPFHNTTETAILLNHEDESTPPLQAVMTGTHATTETTSASIISSSVTSSGESDIDELSPTDSSTSLTGTEIMAMRRQRVVDRIMQHFCRHLDQKLKDRTSELKHRTQKVAVNSVAGRCSSLTETLQEQLSSAPSANTSGQLPTPPGSTLPDSAGLGYDNLLGGLLEMPGHHALEIPERLYAGVLDGNGDFEISLWPGLDPPTFNSDVDYINNHLLVSPRTFLYPADEYGYIKFMDDLAPLQQNSVQSVWSGDSGVHLPESVSGEPSKEGHSGGCQPKHLPSVPSLTNYGSIPEADDAPLDNGLQPKMKLPRLERSTEDFSSVVKNKLSQYTRACDRCKVRKIRCNTSPAGCSHCASQNIECVITDHVTGRTERRGWHPKKLGVDNEPAPPSKANGIHNDPIIITNTHLAINTMTAEFGNSANEINLNHGVQKRAAEDDGDHDGRRKRQRGQANSDRKFACLFFKRNPRKYSKWTCCPGPGWDEIHRVKSHLYRRHELIQCPRCWSTHKNNKSLIAHLQTDPPCEKQQNLSLVDGVTPDQKEKLLSRKKTHNNMMDEEKWRHMYMILFPDDDEDSIPSPYYEESDGSELEDYARFFRREMPPVVRRELESLPDQEFQNRERLLQRLVEIISNMQSRLLDVYRQSLASVHDQRPQSSEVGFSGETRASGSGSGTTSDSPTTPTAPAPDPIVNAGEFANSLVGVDFEGFEVDSEELQRWLDELANDGKST